MFHQTPTHKAARLVRASMERNPANFAELRRLIGYERAGKAQGFKLACACKLSVKPNGLRWLVVSAKAAKLPACRYYFLLPETSPRWVI